MRGKGFPVTHPTSSVKAVNSQTLQNDGFTQVTRSVNNGRLPMLEMTSNTGHFPINGSDQTLIKWECSWKTRAILAGCFT